jgi:hypothetical protein
MANLRITLDLLARELVYRLCCRHRQGAQPNILLYCVRRGGSTWLLNTLAAHPGMRYLGRPFITLLQSRWASRMPDLRHAAGHEGPHIFRQLVHVDGPDEDRFRALASDVIQGRIPIYPTLTVRSPYVHRVTDRIVLQMTSGVAMIEWFDREFDINTVILMRHPIPTAMSILRNNWSPECMDFLLHRWFTDTHLTGEQVDRARAIMDAGSPLAQHVLDWTLKMLIPFRAWQTGDYPHWTTVTYEQLVTNPHAMIDHLASRLRLPDVQAMLAQVKQPSRTVTDQTASRVDDPAYLLSRWRRHVSAGEAAELISIPQAFGIDLYTADDDQPQKQFMIRE